ncbi:hypothetical protein KP509_03G058000 [Ceratopteris richardii]|uniref:adenine phosphoribosyltransferase n=1 Tax=Ceratopteris richardii TaxID=49495 RepID=A0A8T2V769_CERRI|nr:hypothetical protein KP509_03G058000 [Ceratopteris richardii]
MALDDQGNLHGWGWNKFGQVGVGNNLDQNRPQLVKFPNDEGISVKIIAVGAEHTAAVSEDALEDSIDIFVERFKDKKITVVAGIEARGFIFGSSIALALGAKFVPLRKPKKLLGEVIFEEYVLEYGTDRLEMHVGAVQEGDRALVVDDLITTGGTLCAAIKLLERAGAEVVECACIIEIPELKGRATVDGEDAAGVQDVDGAI